MTLTKDNPKPIGGRRKNFESIDIQFFIEYGVTRGAISGIKTGKTWRSVS